jgi:acyl-CoA thioester hydrolase
MPQSSSEAIFRYRMAIPGDAIDGNGHVNNVAYVQWMQEAAIRHFEALGGTPLMAAAGATWVVRSHKIEYLSPAYAGEEIEVRTWIANARRVRSLRRYEFVRPGDGRLLVKGETEWVFVDAHDGRPIAIPPNILRSFPIFESDGAAD